jgi:hypothetical protein
MAHISMELKFLLLLALTQLHVSYRRYSLHTFCSRVDVIWQVANIDIRFLLEYDVGAFFCCTGLQYHFSVYAGQGF